jgi:hypothetical protein
MLKIMYKFIHRAGKEIVLQQIHRVHFHAPAAGPRARAFVRPQRVALQDAHRVRAAQHDLPAVKAGLAGKEARRRADHLCGSKVSLFHPALHLDSHAPGLFFGLDSIGVAIFEAQQASKGRVDQFTPFGQLTLVKPGVIVPGSGLDGVVFRHEGLHHYLAAQGAAPGPPGHLHQ